MKKYFKKGISFFLALVLIFSPNSFFMTSSLAADTANLAQGKSITASSVTQNYVATNANDGNVNTYWEGSPNSYANTLTVDLGNAQSINKVVLKLNPTWETRTQTLSVLTSTDNATYTTKVASATYTFNPSNSNAVTITFADTSARYIRLTFTANSGATAGQVAEIEAYGTAVTTGTPDLVVTDISWSPSNPAVGNAVTFSATVKNQGNDATPAGTVIGVSFIVDGTQVSWSDTTTSSLAAGASLTVTSNSGPSGLKTWNATSGSHNVTAWVDDVNRIAESNENNNQFSKTIIPGTVTPTPTATPTPGPDTNLSVGKSVTASSSIYTFVATNANDGNTSTYWEGSGQPANITMNLGANANITSLVLKLDPSSAWGQRTQTIEVLGHDQNTTTFTTLKSATVYTFNPASGNTVTIPVTATASEIRLNFTTNSGAPAGQIAEFEVYGSEAPNPDLIITNLTSSPTSPIETDVITLTAAVKNIGTASAATSDVKFYMGTTLVGTANTPTIAAGATANVSFNIGAQNAASYQLTAKVDEANTLVELDNSNNNYTSSTTLIVAPVQSADLIGNVSWTPSNPSAGNTVTFTANLKNQGNIASGSGAHGITLVLKNSAGATVKTFNGSYTGSLAAGASVNVSMGTWTAVDGSYTLTSTIGTDSMEVAIKQVNNTSTTSLYSGRGANMPFTVIEAESLANSTNGTRLAPIYKLADYAGEASGHSAVNLDANGEYVEFTLTTPANAFVLRNAIAENTTGTVSIYADGVDKGNFNVTSKYSYVYATPTTLDRLGYDNSGTTAYWLYEDSQLMLDQVYPAGTKIRIQKDAGDVSWIDVDLLETENVAPAATNPDPSKYVQVSSTKSIDAALQEFRNDPTKKGIFIPAGTWTITNQIQLNTRATEVIGAGPWWTKLQAPQDQSNTDVGFTIASSANGSTIKDLSAWGNYQYRSDGPGKFLNGNGMQNVTIDNIWAEHFVCLYWGVNSSYNTFKNCRIKNTFADGINMTNGSSYNTINNCYARATGDDSFAIFSAIDGGGAGYNTGNKFTNLTAVCPRRAACFAVYGGSDNLFQNLYGADTLTYPGVTISSLSFGYNTLGFGDVDCVFDGITLDRCGGDFYTSNGADDKINGYQNFGAIWLFCGDRTFKNILVKNVDINDAIYSGIMFQTKYPDKLSMQNVRFENININRPGRYGIKLCVSVETGQGPCLGSASFTNVKVNNPSVAAIYGQSGCPGFTVNKIGTENNW